MKSQIAQSCCFPLQVRLIATQGTNVSYCHNLPESALAVSSVGVFDVCFYAHSEDYPACPKTVWIERNELNYWGCSVGECWRKRGRERGGGWLRATQCLGDEERKGQDKKRNKKQPTWKNPGGRREGPWQRTESGPLSDHRNREWMKDSGTPATHSDTFPHSIL